MLIMKSEINTLLKELTHKLAAGQKYQAFQAAKNILSQKQLPKEVWSVLESSFVVKHFDSDYLAKYLDTLTFNKGTVLSPQFYFCLEEKLLSEQSIGLVVAFLTNCNKFKVRPAWEVLYSIENTLKAQEFRVKPKDLHKILQFYSSLNTLNSGFQEFLTHKLLPKLNYQKTELNTTLALVKSLSMLENFQNTLLWENLYKTINSQIHHKVTSKKHIATRNFILQTLDAHNTLNPETYLGIKHIADQITSEVLFNPNFLLNGESESLLSKKVEEFLKSHQVTYQKKKALEKFYVVDFLLKDKTALEVDGPTHYLRLTNGKRTQELTGQTLFKSKVLEAKGYKVLRLPFFHLDQEGEAYLGSCLNKFF